MSVKIVFSFILDVLLNTLNNLEIFEFDLLNSTNDFLLDNSYNDIPQLCIANRQTKGRGQYGKMWQEQKRNALFSLKIKLINNVDISGVSLIVGLAIVTVLQANYGLKNLSLKWPNDIFIDGKKMGGILIENRVTNTEQFLVIGVGINIYSDNFSSIGLNINTKQLILRLSENILLYVSKFKQSKFIIFKQQWQQYDFLTNNKILIIYQNVNGASAGVNNEGFLIFKDNNIKKNNKQVIIYSSSQISYYL